MCAIMDHTQSHINVVFFDCTALHTERWNSPNIAFEITFVSLWGEKLKESGENSPCGKKQGRADGAL